MRFKNRISALHYQTGETLSPWLWPLLPLEAGYRLLVSARLAAYDKGMFSRYAPPVPVISVGNLTTGGTGKTPVVIELARGLVRAGKTVVVLSRGYGAERPVDYARALDPGHGDEAYLIQEQVPEAVVIVGRDRVETLKKAVRDYRPDYVLLDDGFQYLRMQRSVNIMLIDGERLLGNKHLLPAGPLREPVSAIRRADMIFLTKTVTTEAMHVVERWLRQANPEAAIPILPVGFQPAGIFRPGNAQTESPQAGSGRNVIALSGIARPEDFERDLETLDVRILERFRFEDHQVYTKKTLQPVLTSLKKNLAREPWLVTTEKDWIKLRHVLPADAQAAVRILKTAPALDGHWFYHEFLTQMPGHHRVGELHVHSSGPGH